MGKMKLFSALVPALLILLSAPLYAQRNPAAYTRRLLPFYGFTAAGWSADWWFLNDGEAAADVFPLAFGGFSPPGQTWVIPAPALPPHAVLLGGGGDVLPSRYGTASLPFSSSTPGVFVFVERSAATRVRIGGELRWSSIEDRSAAPVQAVPEEQFFTGVRSVLPIRTVNNTRYSIRLFALPESIANPRFTVRVFDMQPIPTSGSWSPHEELLWSASGAVSVPVNGRLACSGCDFPEAAYRPALAEFFNVPAIPAHHYATTIRIEISPESPDLRYWAVVSATDNLSNRVQLYTIAP